MSKFIIVKYASVYFPDGKAPLFYHVYDTYTAREVGMTKPFFTSREEAESWLPKMNSFNPTVDYGVLEATE